MIATTEIAAWQPLLGGAALSVASKGIEEIARSLAKVLPGSPPGKNRRGDPQMVSPSLGGGSAGIALFYEYLDDAIPGKGHQRTASRFLDHAIGSVLELPMSPGLYSGFSGVGYAVTHIEKRRSGLASEACHEIDEALSGHLDRSPWRDDYDLINGLVGLGVYSLERLPHPIAKENLERIVKRLDELAEYWPDGITWHTPAGQLLPETRKQFPQGWYNLGLSHGVPGVIAMLGQARWRRVVCRELQDRHGVMVIRALP